MLQYKNKVWTVQCMQESARMAGADDGMVAKIVKLSHKGKKFEVSFWLTMEALEAGSLAAKEGVSMTFTEAKKHGMPVIEGMDLGSADEDSASDGDDEGEGVTAASSKPSAKSPHRGKSPGAKRTGAGAKGGGLGKGGGKSLEQRVAVLGASAAVAAKLAKAGVESVEMFDGLRGGGAESAKEIAVAAGLTVVETALLVKHMGVVQSSFLGGGVDSFDVDDEEEDEVDGEAEPTVRAAKASSWPLAAALLGRLSGEERKEAVLDALDGVCEALHSRDASAREKKQGEAALEVKLKAMGATAKGLVPSPPGGVEEVAAKVTEVATEYATTPKSAGRKGGGLAGGGAEGEVVAGGRADVGMVTALQNLLADPANAKAVAELVALASTGRDEEMVRRLGELAKSEDLAALAYKSGDELKPPAGVRATADLQELVHGVGRVRAKWVDYVVATLRALDMLPAGVDGRELAAHVVRGELDKLDWQALFGCKLAGSLMGSLGGGGKAKRVDSTDDAMLIFSRGCLVLMVAYHAAHPFDGTVVNTLAMLETAVLRAVQKGVPVADGVTMVVDPFVHEMARQWAAVGRRAGMRPLMATVAREMTHNVTALRTLASECTAKDKPKSSKEWQEEVDKLKKELKEAKKVKPPPAGAAFAERRKAWEAVEANKGKCYFLEHFGTCKQGKACNAFATHPGHPE